MWFFEGVANVIVFIIIVVIVLLIIQQIIFQIQMFYRTKTYSFRERHIFITGGSQGLGKCLAQRICKEGGFITIVARRENICVEAKKEIEDYAIKAGTNNIKVQYFTADVTNEKEVRTAVDKAEEVFGPIDFLITCHGTSIPKYAFETTMEEARKVMEINYWGTLNVFRAVIPRMMKRNRPNQEVLSITSQLAICGFIGYAHYCPSKFAVRGLIDVLRNELNGYNIKFHCAYPPGMKTPGFEHEQQSKPDECKEIEKGEELYTPEFCADCIINAVKRGEYHISCGDFGCNMLIRVVIGMTQRNNLIGDFILAPITIIIIYFIANGWYKIARDKKWQVNKDKWFKGLDLPEDN